MCQHLATGYNTTSALDDTGHSIVLVMVIFVHLIRVVGWVSFCTRRHIFNRSKQRHIKVQTYFHSLIRQTETQTPLWPHFIIPLGKLPRSKLIVWRWIVRII